MSLRRALASFASLALAAPALAQPATPSYLLFESGPVRPVALSPNGQKLFVANTPDGHLEIFDVGVGGALAFAASVPVGLEPVAVAARTNSEVWVVNHVSDSVSIVDVASSPPRVVRTLLVGDEPRDIVFAGSPTQHAFIATAHRGQHRTHASVSAVPGAGDPQLMTPSVGRADVWVFDAASPGSAIGGVPKRILSFFADTPRALAAHPDGDTVYVAAFHSGNQTTALTESVVPNGFASSCGTGGAGTGVPDPDASDPDGPGGTPSQAAPETGIILKKIGSDWLDAEGCIWTSLVEFDLPDHDVFSVDANSLDPLSIVEFDHVGTTLFNVAVNPTAPHKLYVTNTEAINDVRFEGPGNRATGAFVPGATVQGQLAKSRITVIDPSGPTVTPRHLNSHIDYGLLHTTGGVNHGDIEAQKPHSLSTPLQLVVSGDQKIYFAAFGSAKVGVIDVAALEAGTFDPETASTGYIATGGGPAGLALNASDDRLYVYTRFDQSLQVFDVGLGAKTLLQTVRLPTPEPAEIVEGRPFLYDAAATSGNGEASCASCHVFGDFDSLAWNLGNPDDVKTANPQPQIGGGGGPDFHPMKGPMTTQTLRGLSTHGAMHWRGDRANGFFGLDACDGASPLSNAACDEELSFDNFLPAFEGLVGGHATVPVVVPGGTGPGGTEDAVLSDVDMQKFTDFALKLALPPNPVASIDGSQTAAQANGEDLYFNHLSDGTQQMGIIPCNTCHVLNPSQGFFGTNGAQSEEGEPQRFKIAHLRNMVHKVGMFGLTGVSTATGPQVRGYGYLHDGSIDTLFNFLRNPLAPFALTDAQGRDLEAFMLAFPSDLAPVVGQQVSVGPGSPGSFTNADVVATTTGRIDVLDARAGAPFSSWALGTGVDECELVARTVESGVARSYHREGADQYESDDGVDNDVTKAVLRDKADPALGSSAQDIHFLCVPPGSGERMGVDRDLDGVQNGPDNCPAWPNGATRGSCVVATAGLELARCATSEDCGAGGHCSLDQQDVDGDGFGDVCELAALPEPGRGLALALGAGLLAALGRRRRRS